jgi:hypothetical protein
LEYRAAVQREAEARQHRHGGASVELAVREVQRIVSRGATLLPKSGPDADWIVRALRGELDIESRSFAVAIVRHRNQFPLTYLNAFVRGAIDLGSSGGDLLRLAARWHGVVAVLDAMTRAAEEGALSYALRRFFQYYVWSPLQEDAGAIDAAYYRLQEATWKAPDAPPGAGRPDRTTR